MGRSYLWSTFVIRAEARVPAAGISQDCDSVSDAIPYHPCSKVYLPTVLHEWLIF